MAADKGVFSLDDSGWDFVGVTRTEPSFSEFGREGGETETEDIAGVDALSAAENERFSAAEEVGG